MACMYAHRQLPYRLPLDNPTTVWCKWLQALVTRQPLCTLGYHLNGVDYVGDVLYVGTSDAESMIEATLSTLDLLNAPTHEPTDVVPLQDHELVNYMQTLGLPCLLLRLP